jgi:hypothetical protein
MHPPRAFRALVLGTALTAAAASALPVATAAQTIAPGSALINVTGAMETSLVLPILPETAAPTDTGFDLRFQDADLDTLNVTFTVDTGRVTDTFVGVGVPGTSIFDDAYFADFLHTQCTTQVVSLDAAGITAVIDCAGLENGAGDATIDLHVELTTVGYVAPSASPMVGSPGPSASGSPAASASALASPQPGG